MYAEGLTGSHQLTLSLLHPAPAFSKQVLEVLYGGKRTAVLIASRDHSLQRTAVLLLQSLQKRQTRTLLLELVLAE